MCECGVSIPQHERITEWSAAAGPRECSQHHQTVVCLFVCF